MRPEITFWNIFNINYISGWGAIRKWPLIRPCQTKVNSDHTIPDQSVHWSDWSAHVIVSDQTNMRLNPPLIRPSQMKMTSDQTITMRKRPVIRLSPYRSDLRSYYCALEPNPRPCNFGLETHRVWSEVTSFWRLNLG